MQVLREFLLPKLTPPASLRHGESLSDVKATTTIGQFLLAASRHVSVENARRELKAASQSWNLGFSLFNCNQTLARVRC